MKIQKQRISKKREQIVAILSGKTLYEKPVLTESIFNTDLVLKIKLPLDKQSVMIDKKKHASLDQFIYNPDQHLIHAYQKAYEQLLEQVDVKKLTLDQIKNDKNIQVRNQVNIRPVQSNQEIEKQYDAVLQNGQKQQIVFPCYVKCQTSIMDSFTLNYNTLIYVLQKKCGFQTTSYFVQEKNVEDEQLNTYIYILLTQDTSHLLKSADKYKIKKEIDYAQIDLFMNEPVDKRSRPYQSHPSLHSLQEQILSKVKPETDTNIPSHNLFPSLLNPNEIVLKVKNKKDKKKINHKLKRKTSIQQNNQKNLNQQTQRQKTDKKQQPQKNNIIKQIFKRIHRNMDNKGYKIKDAINQVNQLKASQQSKLTDYFSELFKKFNQIIHQDIDLTIQQKNYILDINRGKINPKCEKEYILKLKRKRVFELLTELSQKYGFKTYKPPISYFPFILPSKNASFMDRLKGVLLYQQYCTNPYGEYSLFSKMDRIKIAYLNLKQHIRVQNLKIINCDVFALHDNFERYGLLNHRFQNRLVDETIKGGINGLNLLDSWNPLTPYTVDYVTLRNYFGEDTAYQVYLKTHLILYFIFITPLGIIGEVSSQLFIYYNTYYSRYLDRGFSSTQKQQLIFHISFFAVAISIFAFFLARWTAKEQNFKENFVENQTQSTFRYSYKGPYIRNNITDSVNQHSLTINIKSKVIKSLGFLLILVILGGQCGFFHGMRMLIVYLHQLFPQTNVYLISWAHILCYGIFFIFNFIFYRKIIKKLTQKLTSLENIPTQELHRDSKNSKNSLFLIGIQLIPVIFLLIFQPLKHTSCYSSSCYSEFEQYIYSRYVITFIFLYAKLLTFVYLYIGSRKKTVSNDEKNSFNKNFDQNFLQYINFVKSQSQKEEYQLSLEEQTQTLLHYGLFLASFPLSPLLGLANLILQYLIQRIQVFAGYRRPIPKSEIIEFYSRYYKIIMHLSIFVNSWVIFFILQGVQYSFGSLIRIFTSDYPTYEGILIIKICVILIVVILFEILVAIIEYIANETESSMINNRKKRNYEKYIIQGKMLQKNKPVHQIQKIYPFRTIFRTYHKEIIQQSKKGPLLTQQMSQSQQDQASSQHLKAKRV